MTCFKAILVSLLLSQAAIAQPVVAISPDNFTADPLFQRYIGDYFQVGSVIQDKMITHLMESIPEPVKSSVPAIPACGNEMKKALGVHLFSDPLMAKLQSLSPGERQQFASFAQFLHSPDGERLLTLNHQATTPSDQLDANGMPQLASGHDEKLEQIKTLLQSQPQPNTLPQAMFGLGLYLSRISDDPGTQARLAQAQANVLATPACVAMQEQMQAYDKAHPQKDAKH